MAARVLLGQRATVRLAASLAVGTVALYPSIAYAEAPAARKSIYDDYDEASPTPKASTLIPTTPAASSPASEQQYPSYGALPVRRGPTPTDRLAGQIRRARLFLYAQAAATEDGVNAALGRVMDLEQSFTATVASLAPPRESGERLMPGLVYVLVAAMAGSIAARRRNILARATLPVAFGVGAGWAILPFTMRNVGDLAWRYEEKVPAIADAHVRTREGIERGVAAAKLHSRLAAQFVEDKVTETRKAVEGWVRKGK